MIGTISDYNNRRPRKVLHIFGRMDRGGAEVRTLEMMRQLDSSDVLFHYCVLSGKSGTLDQEIRQLGGEVFYQALRPLFPVKFLKLLWSDRPDAVHSHVYLNSGFIVFLAAIAKIPVRIAHFRTTGTDKPRTFRQRVQDSIARKLIEFFATDIVGISEASIAASWSSDWRSDPRCQVIYLGIDSTDFEVRHNCSAFSKKLGVPQQSTLVLHVGRMVEAKNHSRVLSIFAEMVQLDDSAVLILAGRKQQPILSQVLAQIEQYDLNERVIILGESNEIPTLIQCSDVMLFPSTREGLGGAVLEACVSNMPVLASDLQAIKEVALHFPSVKVKSLQDPDHDWASDAITLARTADRNIHTSPNFNQTVFSLPFSLHRHLILWGVDESLLGDDRTSSIQSME